MENTAQKTKKKNFAFTKFSRSSNHYETKFAETIFDDI